MKFNNLIKPLTCFFLFITLTVLINITGLASPIGQPVIALSRMGCSGNFLLEIYQNGQVELRLVSMGKQKHRISQHTLEELTNKFDKANFMAADNREPYQDVITGDAIRFRQGARVATVVYASDKKDPLIKELANEILQATKLNKIIEQATKEQSKSQRVSPRHPCMNSDYVVMFEDLTFK